MGISTPDTDRIVQPNVTSPRNIQRKEIHKWTILKVATAARKKQLIMLRLHQ